MRCMKICLNLKKEIKQNNSTMQPEVYILKHQIGGVFFAAVYNSVNAALKN